MSLDPESALHVSIDHLLEGVQVIGFDWTYLYVNETAARHGERSVHDLVGVTMMHAYPGIDTTPLFRALHRVMTSRQSEELVNEFTYPTGATRWFELRIQPVPVGVCVLSLDITERRTAELQLQQTQKMETVGQLVGGIVHDFNNSLTVMMGNADLVTMRLGQDHPASGELQEIAQAAEQAAALTQQLLAFARKRHTRRHAVAPGEVLGHLEPLLRRLLPRNVGLQLVRAHDGACVWADRTQLEQIVLNLVVNARDAMPTGGTVTMGVHLELPAGTGRAAPDGLAGTVVLSVADTGTGMTPEIQARIFEAFFTTKAEGRGTGLGLAVVREVVEQLGGTIDVASAPGAGSTFTIRLPQSLRGEAPARRREPSGAPSGREAVLLVDGAPGVRSFARTVLQRSGYQVIDAESAEAALRSVTGAGAPVDLLVTDLVLPGMDGAQLAARLRDDFPDVRAVFLSGDGRQAGVDLPAGADVLEKPFTAHALLVRVRDVLNARPA